MWWAAGVESEARLVHVWAAVACWRRAFGRREDVFMLRQVVPTGRAGLFLVRTGHASYFEIKPSCASVPRWPQNPRSSCRLGFVVHTYSLYNYVQGGFFLACAPRFRICVLQLPETPMEGQVSASLVIAVLCCVSGSQEMPDG